ncbi:MAG: ribosomal protein S18-alanine N-acetyltransferase [Immundisolibacteraceae bacterium]|nr:ribosomal protein S18-alanine N-acetyltransferase [Immundisolibacteraceae bacterium]
MVVQLQSDQSVNIASLIEGESSAGLRVTQMLEEHLPLVHQIETQIYDFPWSQRVFADCLAAGYSCLLLWDGVDLVGYSLVAIAAGEAHLLNIGIDRQRQRRGYAGHFLQVVMSITSDLGGKVVYLEVRPSNKAALALYRKFEFDQIGLRKNYYRGLARREDAVVLSRDISNIS